MKRFLAGLATVALMGVLAWTGVRRPEGRQGAASPASHPAEARVHALLRSAWDGDVPAYLAAFVGPSRARLDREVAERGREAFSADLRRAARSRKGHAVFAAEPEGDDVARVTVEAVYPDRNERQAYRLERGNEGWRVAEVETLRGHQPRDRYGAPATAPVREGVPAGLGGIRVETGDDAAEERPEEVMEGPG